MKSRDYGKRLKILDVVSELRSYWPLTLRQVYYRLVAAGVIENNRGAYQMLSKIVSEMRVENILSWDCVQDKTRRISAKRGFEDGQTFVTASAQNFLRGYTRCLVQGQERHVELWVEKDALSGIFEDVAWPYCLRVVTCRGYQSTTMLHGYAERASTALRAGQTPLVLYFGDFDASGVQMFESAQKKLESVHDLRGVQFKRVALTPEIIEASNLPLNSDAVKEKDPRTKAFREKYGDIAVELDALHPRELETLARNAIEDSIDMELFHQQREIEETEVQKIAELQASVQSFIAEKSREMGLSGGAL